MWRLSEADLARIKSQWSHYWDGRMNPFTGERSWFRWTIDGKDVVDLMADLEEAREHRRVLREALQSNQWTDPADHRTGAIFCNGCGAERSELHEDDCWISRALAATEDADGTVE